MEFWASSYFVFWLAVACVLLAVSCLVLYQELKTVRKVIGIVAVRRNDGQWYAGLESQLGMYELAPTCDQAIGQLVRRLHRIMRLNVVEDPPQRIFQMIQEARRITVVSDRVVQ